MVLGRRRAAAQACLGLPARRRRLRARAGSPTPWHPAWSPGHQPPRWSGSWAEAAPVAGRGGPGACTRSSPPPLTPNARPGRSEHDRRWRTPAVAADPRRIAWQATPTRRPSVRPRPRSTERGPRCRRRSGRPGRPPGPPRPAGPASPAAATAAAASTAGEAATAEAAAPDEGDRGQGARGGGGGRRMIEFRKSPVQLQPLGPVYQATAGIEAPAAAANWAKTFAQRSASPKTMANSRYREKIDSAS
ncbi:MAG: hypothetical protein MZU95_09485 [Desulfomicrobium escambiense]|nr:hypothetical protein [Desulfomicrobium escambiense]